MDGRNSFGRRISLLNDDVPTVSKKHTSSPTSKHSPSLSTSSSFASSNSSRLPSFAHSRASSSGASTPNYSPRTPPLVRSDSTDSMDLDLPSPITPEFAGEVYDNLPSASHMYPASHAGYVVQSSKSSMAYPPVPAQNVPLPYPSHARQNYASQRPEAVKTQTAQPQTVEVPVPPAQRSKKGQHPCPLAKQYNCIDTFTTSGHASRHAKKHTGEKSAVCPDCGKDFTRKDNMEQHRKTHLNGRNANKGRNADASKAARSQPKRPKPSPLQSGAARESTHSAMSISSVTSQPQQQLPDFVTPSYYQTAPSSSALHALANAATDERRYISY